MPTVLVADAQPVFRVGLNKLLGDAGFAVSGQATDPDEALRELTHERPAMCLLDPFGFGDWAHWLSSFVERKGQTRIVVVCGQDEALYAERCVRMGASGFLPKAMPCKSLIAVLKRIRNDEVYFGPRAKARLLRRVQAGHAPTDDPLTTMSRREHQVFALLGQSLSTQEIADRLDISPKTVESHFTRLREKLGTDRTTDLRLLAYAWLRS